jgi:hypothetical protein
MPCRLGAAGERFRGIMFALRLAAATQRVLLLDWTHPVALTEFLVPSLIDWRITPDVSAALRGNQLRVHWSHPSQPVPAEVRTSGQPAARPASTRCCAHSRPASWPVARLQCPAP